MIVRKVFFVSCVAIIICCLSGISIANDLREATFVWSHDLGDIYYSFDGKNDNRIKDL